jgi:leader peptidase (prepilin peptidase)/N-methyltransferase
VAWLGPTILGLKYMTFGVIMIALVATDFEERILPDEFTLGGLLAGLIFAAFVPMEFGFAAFVLPRDLDLRWVSVIEAAVGAVIASGAIWMVGWLYQKVRHREGLGLGDVKMIAMIASFLGLEGALLTLIAASLVGSIGGLLFIWLAKKDASTYELPFGSFLGLAAMAVAVYVRVMSAG